MSQLSSIERHGFAIASGVLDERTRLDLIRDVEGLLLESSAGVRGLAAKAPSVAALARSAAVRSLVEPVLGSQARLVRSILFNKSLDANWQVAWHQDLTIAVASQEEAEGYSSWSVKEGVVHVQPPVQVLEQMLSVRLHLDPADETNGALWVAPASHRLGRLPAGDGPGRSNLGELFTWSSLVRRCQSHLCGLRLPHEEVLPAMGDAADVQRLEQLSTVDRLSTRRGQGPFRDSPSLTWCIRNLR